ncbi:hypothetical protein PHLCEN_2v10650 [Hermanssonia centrifuga]|uniref:Uncharacterized protein n=1 Tax=Hermanssonia centrifuga TaxID=98765 RepID=A0A2R6NM92_9APHY|nr:hypothetical protein PHLCEN_2v10650 [Hermanssonia centrifuga]
MDLGIGVLDGALDIERRELDVQILRLYRNLWLEEYEIEPPPPSAALNAIGLSTLWRVVCQAVDSQLSPDAVGDFYVGHEAALKDILNAAWKAQRFEEVCRMVDDFLDDTDAEQTKLHKRLSKYVRKAWLPSPSVTLSSDELHDLWDTVCGTVGPQLRFIDFHTFYRDNKNDLDDLLNTAWKTQEFKDVCRRVHKAFNIPYSGRSPGAILDPAAALAWRAPYQLDSHKMLYATINNMYTAAKIDGYGDYWNNVSVVQSSGTGKSRMVDEQATLVVTCPFNLRQEESSYSAYPDASIRDYLINTDGAVDVEVHYHLFFICLFRKLSAHFRTIKGRIPRQKMATDWKNHLKDRVRYKFYKDLIDDIEALNKTFDSSETTHNLQLKAMITGIEELDLLVKIIRARTSDSDDSVQLVIYFDDAQPLFKTDFNNGKSYFQSLLDVLCAYRMDPVFVVFLSTISHLGRLPAVPQGNFSSARAHIHQTHQATITELPFDCAPPEYYPPVQPYTLTVEDITQIPFMARFGRPLYWAMLSTLEGTELEKMSQTLIEIIRGKLIDERTDISPDNTKQYATSLAPLAVTDVRLCLQYAQHTVMDTHAALVASHMRIAYSAPRHRGRFHSGYSSEPILAKAAAKQLEIWRKKSSTALIDPLLACADFMDFEEREQLVARALLVEAYDAAVARTHAEVMANKAAEPSSASASTDGWCKAVHFIEALFQEDYAAAILDSRPDNTVGSTLREVLKESTVHFTQWVRAFDDHVVTTLAMAPAFIRGMAFICCYDQPQIDLLIPILLSNTTIGESHMSAFLIQVGQREDGVIYPISAETLGFFKYPKTARPNQRPYISLVMDLGVRVPLPNSAQHPAISPALSDISKAQNIAGLRQVGTSSIQTQKQPMAAKSEPGKAKTAPSRVNVNSSPLPSTTNMEKDEPWRYTIHAFGCSDAVYKAIRPEDKQKWQKLLMGDEILVDRPHKESFALGKESYHWFNDPLLNSDHLSVDPRGPDQTAVFVGEYLDEVNANVSPPRSVKKSVEQDNTSNEQPQND